MNVFHSNSARVVINLIVNVVSMGKAVMCRLALNATERSVQVVVHHRTASLPPVRVVQT